MSARRLSTKRLDLVTATAQHLLVHLEDAEKMARLLAAQLPESWPPAGLDEDEIRRTIEASRGPEQMGWWLRYVVERKGEDGKRWVVGVAGFHGPPGDDGALEAQASMVEGAAEGLGSEAVSSLVDWAFSQQGTLRITMVSGGIAGEELAAIGFVREGDGPWVKTREAWLDEGPPSRRAPPLVPQPADTPVVGLPPVAKEVFERLTGEPLVEVEALRTQVRDYVKVVESAAADNPYVDDILARDIARVCEGLFDAILEHTPEHTRRQIQAVARYFVTEEDGDSDLAIGGLDEDAAVANAIAEHLGRGDLVSDLL